LIVKLCINYSFCLASAEKQRKNKTKLKKKASAPQRVIDKMWK